MTQKKLGIVVVLKNKCIAGLFTDGDLSVDESIVIFCPIFHFGCFKASFGEILRSSCFL